jgi:hypothetical protein
MTTTPKRKRILLRPKRTIYGEAIRTIFEKFIRPLAQRLNQEEDEQSLKKAIADVFNHKTRYVTFSKATSSFRMPGKTWRYGRHDRLISGVHNRWVKKGDTFIVRIDEEMYDRIELEKGKEEGIIFVLNHAQWTGIKDHLEVIA